MIAFKAIFLQYLLLPLCALIMIGIMFFVQKKNVVTRNKTLVIYLVISSIVLALPGIAGMAGSAFSPYWYLLVQIVYLGLGTLHVQLLSSYFKQEANSFAYTLLFESIVTLICMIFGAYLFTLIFNWLSPYEGYAWMAATTIFAFILPLAFYYTYLCFMDIPFSIYKVWYYNPHSTADDFEGIDFDTLMVLNLEFTKKVEDGHRFAVKAKAPASIKLGEWFNRFIEDYNLKYTKSKIEIYNEMAEPHAWIFYIKRSFFHPRRYLDFEKSIMENKVTEKHSIICKRVIQNEEEKIKPLKTYTNKSLLLENDLSLKN